MLRDHAEGYAPADPAIVEGVAVSDVRAVADAAIMRRYGAPRHRDSMPEVRHSGDDGEGGVSDDIDYTYYQQFVSEEMRDEGWQVILIEAIDDGWSGVRAEIGQVLPDSAIIQRRIQATAVTDREAIAAACAIAESG